MGQSCIGCIQKRKARVSRRIKIQDEARRPGPAENSGISTALFYPSHRSASCLCSGTPRIRLVGVTQDRWRHYKSLLEQFALGTKCSATAGGTSVHLSACANGTTSKENGCERQARRSTSKRESLLSTPIVRIARNRPTFQACGRICQSMRFAKSFLARVIDTHFGPSCNPAFALAKHFDEPFPITTAGIFGQWSGICNKSIHDECAMMLGSSTILRIKTLTASAPKPVKAFLEDYRRVFPALDWGGLISESRRRWY